MAAPPVLPPRAAAAAPRAAANTARRALQLGPATRTGQAIGIYGPGGIGKTSLAATVADAFIDLDGSISTLGLDVPVVQGIANWADLRAVLQGDGWDGVKTLAIDTLTKAEELAEAHTLATVPTEKGSYVKSLVAYGYGKGYEHLYDTFMGLLADLDTHRNAGRNIVLIMHDCVAKVPNPSGDDYVRNEPRLQTTTSGKASVRYRVREWLDHLFFIGYDVFAKDGKASGNSTRTLYPVELPHAMAKSRKLSDQVEILPGSDVLINLLKS